MNTDIKYYLRNSKYIINVYENGVFLIQSKPTDMRAYHYIYHVENIDQFLLDWSMAFVTLALEHSDDAKADVRIEAATSTGGLITVKLSNDVNNNEYFTFYNVRITVRDRYGNEVERVSDIMKRIKDEKDEELF